MKTIFRAWAILALASSPLLALTPQGPGAPGTDFVHWETGHVHPLDLTPDGTKLLAVNTADARLEIFDLSSGSPQLVGAVQVGVDPVTVRALDNRTAWVVNHISDTISVVNVATRTLIETIQTPDEPSDVVFTGTSSAGKAWVSCAHPNQIAVFDLANLALAPSIIPIAGEDPKAMAKSPDDRMVYVGIQTSGNNTTILNGGTGLAPNIVSDAGGPYGGQNPPPNSGTSFVPPLNPASPFPPPVGLIVRKNGAGSWRDDNNGDWTPYVSGAQANAFGRLQGWDLLDHDLAIIDTSTQTVRYARGLMNIVMAITVLPVSGGHVVSVVGTEATNEIRYEPNLKSRFVRVHGAAVDPISAGTIGVVDLNPALVAGGYAAQTAPQNVRDQSLGDPRGIVFNALGTIGWVTGMGSNNVAKIGPVGNRLSTIEVGAGPTGVAVDRTGRRVYVLNKFAGSVSVIDATTDAVLAEVPFHDPTPLAVKRGRLHLYDTHRTSGLGQVSCAACHVNGSIDNLAWDLGNPAGELRIMHSQNLNLASAHRIPLSIGAETFHPMKGPMTTQTLQDIVGKEPFHWRGDKKGIEEFNSAFVGLLGDDTKLTAAEMQEFEDFLASIWFPPNPHRLKSNELNTAMDLTSLQLNYKNPATGALTPLTVGDAKRGFDLYMPVGMRPQDGVFCVTCHTNPTGVGPDLNFDPVANIWSPVPIGAHGEHHSSLFTGDPNTQRPFKIPQLRNMHKKTGFNLKIANNTQGFGYAHDGIVDTIAEFLSEPVFVHTPGNEAQDVADLAAFMLSYSGSGFPLGSLVGPDNPPGPPGLNSHAGVGFQWTVKQGNPLSTNDFNILNAMFTVQGAAPGDLSMIVKQNQVGGGQRGFAYIGSFNFLGDSNGVTTWILPMLTSIGPGTEATFTLVPAGTEVRAGVDRDADGYFDATETALGTNPDSARSVPTGLGVPCTSIVPATPSAIGVTALGPYQVQVTWTPGSANQTGFAVERSWNNSPQWMVVAELPAASTVFNDTSAAPTTAYRYRVRAYNCAGTSASATSGVVTTPVEPPTVTCHVHAIDLQTNLDVPPGTLVGAWGTVNVVDDQGRGVQGATVTCSVTGPSGVVNPTAVTNEHGQALFWTNMVPRPASGPWTFSVLSITSSPSLTVIYNPAANVVTSNAVVE